jgi:dienelactone hydrolase
MVTWRNRSIESLTTAELRQALDDALGQIAWSRSQPSANSFFQALLIGFCAGAAVAVTAVGTIAILA